MKPTDLTLECRDVVLAAITEAGESGVSTRDLHAVFVRGVFSLEDIKTACKWHRKNGTILSVGRTNLARWKLTEFGPPPPSLITAEQLIMQDATLSALSKYGGNPDLVRDVVAATLAWKQA